MQRHGAQFGRSTGQGCDMKRAVIVCNPDAFANGVRPRELRKFLEAHSYQVDFFFTAGINRLGSKGILRALPGASLDKLLLYLCGAIHLLANRQPSITLKRLATSAVMPFILRLRGRIIRQQLAKEHYDLLVCERCVDEAVVRRRVASVQILDLPVPYAEELYYGGELTERTYASFAGYESRVYQEADWVTFHWHTYTDYVARNKYDGDNLIELGYGAPTTLMRATYRDKPRVAFLGLLEGYWVNLSLLEKLSELYPIDVYGAPRPKGYRITYKGYAPTPDVLAEYQFGLITITNDPLRRSSFSSKQLDYYAYGLPVLTPRWRADSLLQPGAIPFTEEDFAAQIEEYSDPVKWQQKSDAALALAEQLTWEKAFEPLRDLLAPRTSIGTGKEWTAR
jgi:hypothetical protein